MRCVLDLRGQVLLQMVCLLLSFVGLSDIVLVGVVVILVVIVICLYHGYLSLVQWLLVVSLVIACFLLPFVVHHSSLFSFI